MANDDKNSFGYWERRAVEQDAELHNQIKKPESTILTAYVQAQEYLKTEAKKIFDRYANEPGMTESMLKDVLNTKASDTDLASLIALLKTIEDKDIKKQIQAYLNALAAKSRISQLEMMQAKAYVVVKQIADVQLHHDRYH